ncbi:DUF2231 domain-containing protein [Chryseobacterium sp.]|uniref:DUF2231 domain-containing protein n=1 Tax=Chryseobacterium sp. TaxID=1871047 RepID=UPI0011CC9400|nr:DUF2231 domain-containing protein [Chryseobacterium sp.]TXF78827.1 DUF2231 domain-containing protein [Chryseobacterium sp.]
MISPTHLHAMVIHFPIALLLTAFLGEIIGLILKKTFLNQAAFYLLILGTFGTLIAYLSGDAAGDGMEGGSLGKAIMLHEEAAALTLWLAIITTLLYGALYFFKSHNRWYRIVGIILFATVIGSVTRTAYLGGQLVYRHGAGVELEISE